MGEEDNTQKIVKQTSKVQPSRHSSRIQDDGTNILSKTTAMKAASFKGTSSSTNKAIPPSASSTKIDDITRVCGISLGSDEAVRIANISFIQAKEEAAMALLKAKKKTLLSSGSKNLEVVVEVDSNRESDDQNIELNLKVDRAVQEHNLSKSVSK